MIRILLAVFLLLAPTLAAAGLIVAPEPRAAEAGREMLRAGGSAADAAMAVMLALTVTEPAATGIGGGGFLLHHDGKSGTLATIDAREAAPASARPGLFLDPDGKPLPFSRRFPGGKSVGVPGNVAMIAEAHRRWGRLPWAKLFEPAIRLAEQGFPLAGPNPPGPWTVQPTLVDRLAQYQALWKDFPEARAVYWKDGAPLRAGDHFRNPELARTLRLIAAKGPKVFYAGKIAARIRRAVASSPINPARISAADMAGYRVKDRDPICGEYRGYRICGMGPPSSGAITDLMILGMLERFDLAALGQDSSVAWHLIGEAMRLAYADRDAWLGDADFAPVPVAGLLDRAYLVERSKLIAPDRTLGDYKPGVPPGAPELAVGAPAVEQGTSHMVAVDDQGGIISMTTTVEGPMGSQLVVAGMVLNNELTDFAAVPADAGRPVPNRVEPGKRPLSSMAPTIVYAPDGRPWLAVGSGGGRMIIMHSLKTIIGTIDWKLPVADAVRLPNIFFNGPALVVERGSALERKLPGLASLGETAIVGDLSSKIMAAERTSEGWAGAADPRTPGVALSQ